MHDKFKLALTGLAVLGLAACATAPRQRYASSVKAAQAAGRPLVVYGLGGTYGLKVVSRKPQEYEPAYYVAIQFINVDPMPLQKLTFTLSASFDYKPVLNADGTPLQIDLSTAGPVAPGAAAAVVASLPLTEAQSVALGGACLQLDGIQVTKFSGQGTREMSASQASAYLTPQMKPRVICAPYPARPSYPSWLRQFIYSSNLIYYPPMPRVYSHWSLPDPPLPRLNGDSGGSSGPAMSQDVR